MFDGKTKRDWTDYLERTKRNHFWMGGIEGQAKMKSIQVGVAGLGGMGSNIAEILVRLGIQNLRLADPDIIELSNLNRQVIANLKTLGKTKLQSSIQELQQIDPNLKITEFSQGITPENAEDFVRGLDVVINEIDVLHIPTQIHLLEAARKHNIPVYTTLVVGLGVHLYKYSPTSSFHPRDFLGPILNNPSLDVLLKVLAEPLPNYLQGTDLQDFKAEVTQNGGIPIFGASTYLGQSLLVIRTLLDLGLLRSNHSLPETPCLPHFLVLDPLTLQFEIADIGSNG